MANYVKSACHRSCFGGDGTHLVQENLLLRSVSPVPSKGGMIERTMMARLLLVGAVVEWLVAIWFLLARAAEIVTGRMTETAKGTCDGTGKPGLDAARKSSGGMYNDEPWLFL